MLEDIMNVSLSEGLIVTVFSMFIVFLTLIVICFVLFGFKKLFYKENNIVKNKTKKPERKRETIKNKNEDEEELVAVLTAAVAECMGKNSSQIRIRNIKRIKQNTSAWTKAGREEQIYNKI
ncbi:MAG: hypothetical protein FH753_17095 [Firmicutes bacterium]|nr:hypothetical protein [Bacillota bacterium]